MLLTQRIEQKTRKTCLDWGEIKEKSELICTDWASGSLDFASRDSEGFTCICTRAKDLRKRGGRKLGKGNRMAQISPFLSFFSCLFVLRLVWGCEKKKGCQLHRITLAVQWAAYLTWRENRNYDKGVCTPRKKYAKNLTYHQSCTQFSEQVILKPLQVSWGLSQVPGAGTPGEAAAVQAPNTTRGVAEDADTYRGSSHAMEWWKQVINMHHTVPKAEPAANECCAEGSGHGFAKFCVLGTPVKHNTEMQLGSCSHQRASHCKWAIGVVSAHM